MVVHSLAMNTATTGWRQAVRPGLVATCVLALACAHAGCGNNQAKDKTQATDNDKDPKDTSKGPETGLDKGQPDDTSKGKPPMAAGQGDTAVIQEYFAKEFKVDAADIKVRIQKRIKVPGVTFFTAMPNPQKAGRNASRKGIVEGGQLYFENEAMSHIAKAWKYGADRPVKAAKLARALAYVHSKDHEVSTILDEDTLKIMAESMAPGHAAAAAVPKETTVDGHPAVEYCLKSGDRGMPPFQVVTAIVKPDFQVELRTKKIDK